MNRPDEATVDDFRFGGQQARDDQSISDWLGDETIGTGYTFAADVIGEPVDF